MSHALRRRHPSNERSASRNAAISRFGASHHFTCDLSRRGLPLPRVWEHTVGSGHASLALRSDWQEQLARCRRELGFGHVRFHGILCDDVGTLVAYRRRPVYSFFNADRIWDFLLSIGMHPFVELSFMPEVLASGRKTVFRYRANVTPPRSYRRWRDLVGRLVRHARERYGHEELTHWLFEVWNEPNLRVFWTGSRAAYFRLYREAAGAVKDVDPSIPVGGPATAQNAWVGEFLDFCEEKNVPADFVSTHHYPNDGFGGPRDDVVTRLSKSRRSALAEQARAVRAQARGRPLYYTEWSASTGQFQDLHDEPYAAAFAVKTVLEAVDLVDGYSWWTFSDLFEENYFPSAPFHGGFGLLTIHGIAKPVYRAFELLHRLGDERLAVSGRHETVDAWAARRGGSVTILLTNWALPRNPIRDETVRVGLTGAPTLREAYLERIDESHGNARRLWEEMGRPEYPSAKQIEALQAASRLTRERIDVIARDGSLSFQTTLKPQSVASATLELA